MTPDKLIQSVDTFHKGDMGFCVIASVSIRNYETFNNIGFWFEVIENDTRPVLSVQMESFTTNKPVPKMVITGFEQLRSYINKVRHWAESELIEYFSMAESHHNYICLENYEHSKSA